MEGWRPPSKNFPLPLSQMDSIFDKEEDKSFSASAAACGSVRRPRTGPRTVFTTNVTEIEASIEKKKWNKRISQKIGEYE